MSAIWLCDITGLLGIFLETNKHRNLMRLCFLIGPDTGFMSANSLEEIELENFQVDEQYVDHPAALSHITWRD